MPKTEFWNEQFIFMKASGPVNSGNISFYSYLDSTWFPGAQVGAGGGEYAVHYLVKTGRCAVQFGTDRVINQPGSFTVMHRAYRSAKVLGAAVLERKVFLLHRTSLLNLMLEQMFGATEFSLPLRDIAPVEHWLDQIKAEMQDGQSGPRLAGFYCGLLHELRRQKSVDLLPEQLRAILHYIDNHISKPELTRQHLADKFSISIRTLCRLFENDLHTSPGAYITDLRLAQVRRMLAIPTLSIKGIAVQTGFAGSNYLCRVFRRRFGISPEKFRSRSAGGVAGPESRPMGRQDE